MDNESRSIFSEDDHPLDLTLLVLSGCSIMCVASAIDPLRAANRVAGRAAFAWRLVSLDGQPAITTCGLPVAVDGSLADAPSGEVLVVIGGFGTRIAASGAIVARLRRLARRARAIGGVEAGGWLLGHAGLLDGRRVTTHWEDLEDFEAAFPHARVSRERYVIDGPVFTTGGASPTFDLMLHLVRTRLGTAVALDVASVFIYDQSRAGGDPQPLVSLGRLAGHDPRLVRAIGLMEAHLEHPLTTGAIARRIGISARTLEMLFADGVGLSPGAYFQRLRLSEARRLVLDTREPMTAIATRTGYGSAAAFSRAFATAFGRPPGRMRRSGER